VEVSAKELRGRPGKYIEQAARGTDIVITIRGKRVARLVPYVENADSTAADAGESAGYGTTGEHSVKDEIFGLWADHAETADVDGYLRTLRQGRRF